MAEHVADRALPPARREERDVGLRFMLGLFALIGFMLVLSLGVAFLAFPGSMEDRRFAQPFPDFPSPALQPSPRRDMQAFYAAEMAHLNSAGWQDRKAGIVHIPIDQAMRAIAAEGIPGWPTAPPNSTAGLASDGGRR